MAVRNIARGGGKSYKPQIVGLKELEKKLKALKLDHPEIVNEMYDVVGEAAADVRDDMRSSARAADWATQKATIKTGKRVGVVSGNDAIDSIFSGTGPRAGGRKRISALAGVGKRRTMVEWRAGRFPKSPRAQVPPGSLVAMSLAAMLEMGTTNRAARPAIRKAIIAAKSRIIDKIADGFSALIAKYSK
jgi:hypothetical protein